MNDNNELEANLEQEKIAEIEQDQKAIKKKRAAQRASRTKKRLETVELFIKGASKRDIAKVTGQAPSTVDNVLGQFAPIFKELTNVPGFQQNKTTILDAATLAYLKKSLSDGAMDKCGANHLAYAAKVTYDMGRLERGQSTANIAHCHFTKVNPTDLEGEL